MEPLNVYLVAELKAQYDMNVLLQREVRKLQQTKTHLIHSVHRLEAIALEESFRVEAYDELLQRLLTRESFHVRDSVIATVEELQREGDVATENMTEIIREHQTTESDEVADTIAWLETVEDMEDM